jgi:hypothetical protein
MENQTMATTIYNLPFAMKELARTAAKESGRYAITGVKVELGAKSDPPHRYDRPAALRLIATDGRRLAIIQDEKPAATGEHASALDIIIPTEVVKRLAVGLADPIHRRIKLVRDDRPGEAAPRWSLAGMDFEPIDGSFVPYRDVFIPIDELDRAETERQAAAESVKLARRSDLTPDQRAELIRDAIRAIERARDRDLDAARHELELGITESDERQRDILKLAAEQLNRADFRPACINPTFAADAWRLAAELMRRHWADELGAVTWRAPRYNKPARVDAICASSDISAHVLIMPVNPPDIDRADRLAAPAETETAETAAAAA